MLFGMYFGYRILGYGTHEVGLNPLIAFIACSLGHPYMPELLSLILVLVLVGG